MHNNENRDEILIAKVAKILKEREEMVRKTAFVTCIEKLVQENEKLNTYLIQRDRALDELKTENKELLDFKEAALAAIPAYSFEMSKRDKEIEELKGRNFDERA